MLIQIVSGFTWGKKYCNYFIFCLFLGKWWDRRGWHRGGTNCVDLQARIKVPWIVELNQRDTPKRQHFWSTLINDNINLGSEQKHTVPLQHNVSFVSYLFKGRYKSRTGSTRIAHLRSNEKRFFNLKLFDVCTYFTKVSLAIRARVISLSHFFTSIWDERSKLIQSHFCTYLLFNSSFKGSFK